MTEPLMPTRTITSPLGRDAGGKEPIDQAPIDQEPEPPAVPTLPVVIARVVDTTGVDDPAPRLVADCRTPEAATEIVALFARLRRSGQLVGPAHDGRACVASTAVLDLDLPLLDAAGAVAAGYALRATVERGDGTADAVVLGRSDTRGGAAAVARAQPGGLQ